MSKLNHLIFAFNRGRISRLALARVDLEKRVGLSAEEQTNWVPRTLGSMMLRPGWRYTGATNDNDTAVHIPFVFALDDQAIVELTDLTLRVKVDETPVTRASVSTAVTNGTFTTDLTGWTDADESGCASTFAAGGYLQLLGNGTLSAIRTQALTVATNDRGVEHALRVVVARGPVRLRVGTTSGEDNFLTETELATGTHSLAFTPTSNCVVYLASRLDRAVLVDSVSVEASGVMTLPAPWAEADLSLIRWDQSGDVIFVACDGYQQRRIERRGETSWSLVTYYANDGPFLPVNVTNKTLTPSATSGNITLTASQAFFRTGHIGALFRLTSSGQLVTDSFSGDNDFSSPIEVSGVDNARVFSVVITGTFTATVRLQSSVDEGVSWVNVAGYSSATSVTYDDGLDNQVVLYRMGIQSSDYSSGTAVITLTYSAGSITGVARVTGYASSTSVTAEVLAPLGGTAATSDWAEGEWSDQRGWPTAVAFDEGRLWWAGRDKVWGSVSDAFDSFDEDVEGDSAPINRSIGSGPVDRINWLLSLQRLVLGGQGAEHTSRSNSLEEPLTATNFTLKQPSTQGSAAVPAAKIDTSGVFVQRGGSRVYMLEYDGGTMEYQSLDLTAIAPEVGEPQVTRLAVQRQPDTRVHCLRSDGTVALLILDPAEDVKCWVEVETDGLVEDVFVMPSVPGEIEDKVYYLVNRTVDGATVRYLERWALESECVGGALNKQADSFILYSGVAASTITGLSHLEGEEVVVWADGVDLSPGVGDDQTTYTVDGGQITLGVSVEEAVIGLPYSSTYKSTKLAYGAQMGTALTQRKRVDHIGLILADTHAKGIQYGSDEDNLDDLPEYEDGTAVDEDAIHEAYDKDSVEFSGTYDTDARIVLKGYAPRPVTVLAAVVTLNTHEKI